MKIRPLPEIDLARIAPLPPDQKRKALEQMRVGRPPYSYGPVRRTIGDIFNIEAGLFGPVEPIAWEKIAATVQQVSRSTAEAEANLAVAHALHSFATLNRLKGRRHEFWPLPLGVGERVQYWSPLVLAVEGQPVVPFIDPRRTSKWLTAEGRRFAFSVMNERIRVADPDFAEVRLGIFQFRAGEGASRVTILHTDEGVELFDFDALESMVRETYELWQEVCEVRAEETRRRAGGMRGSLL